MSTVNETKSINDILSIINKNNAQFTYGVWVPSLEKEVQFKEMNTEQQKAIVKTIVDSSAYDTNFIEVTNNIIRQNCAEDIDIDNLTIIDKFFILIKIRSVCVDKIVELKKGEQVINLEDIIENAKKNVSIPKQAIIENSLYKIYVNVPTIKNEKTLEINLFNKIKPVYEKVKNNSGSINSIKDIGDVMAETYTYELLKYINAVDIINNEEVISINFNDINIPDRIKIIDQIPNLLINKVVEYVQQVKTEIDKILIVKVINGTEVEEERLSITGDFFIKS